MGGTREAGAGAVADRLGVAGARRCHGAKRQLFGIHPPRQRAVAPTMAGAAVELAGAGTEPPRTRMALTMVAVVGAIVAVCLTAPARTGAETAMLGAAFGQTSPVGALFMLTSRGQLEHHFCTASVVDSPSGDLVLTAAHCMEGRSWRQMAFVPDYHDGTAPYGVWTISRMLVNRPWRSSGNVDDDFAFLVVRREGARTSVENLTGGESIATGEPAGQVVKVVGYPDGDDGLISCQRATQSLGATQYAFDCQGFTAGTSGSPFLANVSPVPGLDSVIGVIGGYENGGTSSSVSYATRFNAQLRALYKVALAYAGGS
jgi:V8-like Glu-specific endopeptidase